MKEKGVIEVKGLCKSFGDQKVLDNLYLTVHENENLVVMGQSGSGKSVLIKCIIGLLEPEHGEIKVLGNRIDLLDNQELHDLRRRVGFLFQQGALYDSMSVEENLRFPLEKTTQLKEEEIQDRIDKALEDIGLLEMKNKMPSELSGGMNKRIAMARAFIMEPEVMFYDEPTSGLDSITAREISELIVELQEKQGISSIIITHDLASAKLIANRIVVLHEGKIEEEGTYEELESSTKPYVKAFFE